MTVAGWIIMTASLSSVCLLTAFCFYRLLTLPPREVEQHVKPLLEIDTKDTVDAD